MAEENRGQSVTDTTTIVMIEVFFDCETGTWHTKTGRGTGDVFHFEEAKGDEDRIEASWRSIQISFFAKYVCFGMQGIGGLVRCRRKKDEFDPALFDTPLRGD